MQPCKPGQADVFLDGLGYRFRSYQEAEAYVKRLHGRRGVVFTARCRERFGSTIPVPPVPPVAPPRGEDVLRLPEPEEESP